MTLLQQYSWEATHIALIGGAITTLTLVTHLTVHDASPDRHTSEPATISQPHALQAPHGRTQAAPIPSPSDPHEVVIGPSGISGRFILLATHRKPSTSTTDELTLRLRVVSLAAADLVTPFQATMLEVQPEGSNPLSPQHPFSHPVPAGNTRDESILFAIPSSLNLDHTTLRIHYYNDQKEVPLNLPPYANPPPQ